MLQGNVDVGSRLSLQHIDNLFIPNILIGRCVLTRLILAERNPFETVTHLSSLSYPLSSHTARKRGMTSQQSCISVLHKGREREKRGIKRSRERIKEWATHLGIFFVIKSLVEFWSFLLKRFFSFFFFLYKNTTRDSSFKTIRFPQLNRFKNHRKFINKEVCTFSNREDNF